MKRKILYFYIRNIKTDLNRNESYGYIVAFQSSKVKVVYKNIQI